MTVRAVVQGLDRVLVSVVIPAFKVEKYIERCVRSIEAQDHRALQIIVVDDGSPDGSASIVEALASTDPRIELIRQENSGVSAARNKGVMACKGDWIAFVDGDDWLEPDFVSTLLAVAMRDRAELVISTGALVGGARRGYRHHRGERWTNSRAAAELLYPEIPLGVWNKLFSRALITRANLRFDTSLIMGEGLTYILQASLAAQKVSITSRALYNYRKDNHSSATTAADMSRAINALQAVEQLRGLIGEQASELQRAMGYHQWMTEVYSLEVALKLGGMEASPEFCRARLREIRSLTPGVLLRSRISWRRRLKVLLVGVAPLFTLRYIASRSFT